MKLRSARVSVCLIISKTTYGHAQASASTEKHQHTFLERKSCDQSVDFVGSQHQRDLLAFRALPHQANGIHAAEAMTDRVLNRTLMTVRILAHVERANGKERIQSSTSPARMLAKVRSPQRGITQRMSTNSVWPWFSGSLHLNSQTSGPYWRFLRVFFIFEEVFICSGRGLFVRRPRFEVVVQTTELVNEHGQLAFCIFEFARGDEADINALALAFTWFATFLGPLLDSVQFRMDALHHRVVWLLRENALRDVQGFAQDSMTVLPGVDLAIHASHSHHHHLVCLP